MNKKNIKIAIMTTTFFPQVGGAEYQVKWLAEELSNEGNHVFLFTPYDSSEFIDSSSDNFLLNIPLRKKGLNIIVDAIRMVYLFIRSTLKLKPDVIHAHFAFSSGFLAVLTKPIHRTPVVITSHGEDIQLVENINYGLRTSCIKRLLIKVALRYCDKHVIVSSSMKKDALCSGSSDDNIKVIYNMFKPPTTDLSAYNKDYILNKYDVDRNSKIILSVSRLHSQKGLNYLIDSMVAVLNDYPNTTLLIAGSGPERERLEQLCHENDINKNVKFLGYITDEDKLLLTKYCDIFCLPSIEEAFGIGLFDPMYFSKSIVATNVGGIPEVLGKTDILVSPKDPSSLANAIINLLSQNSFVPQYPFNQLKHFYPKVIIHEYIELYHNLLIRAK